MSTIDKITKITDRAGTGAPNFTNGFTIAGVDSGLTVFTHTEGNTEPSSPSNGDTWWDTDNDIYYVRMNDAWKNWLGVASSAVTYGDRGFSIGGVSARTQIDYWDMTTSGNSADFGDLATSMTSAPLAGGSTMFAITSASVESFNPATLGNASSYCSHNLSSTAQGTAQSNGTIVIHAVGTHSANTYGDDLSQFSTTTGSTATDFGNLTTGRRESASCSNGTRFVCMGGDQAAGNINTLDYVDYDTVGNATDFGDLTRTATAGAGAGTGEGDRGVYMGGGASGTNNIDYITVSSPGNAADFGDLAVGNYFNDGCANATKAHSVAGYNYAAINNIQEITMATLGNASDFGDLSHSSYYHRCASGAAS